MTETDGFARRLLTALTTNVAEAAEDSPLAAGEVYDNARQAMQSLGWEISVEDRESMQLQAVVTSRILRFRDDVTVRLESIESGGTRLFVRSASRVGRGDLGTNRRRIVRFLQALYNFGPAGVGKSSREPTG